MKLSIFQGYGGIPMKHPIRNTSMLALICFLLFGGLPAAKGMAQQNDPPGSAYQPSGAVQELIRSLSSTVSEKIAGMGFDYRERPVIGVLVADFLGPSGEEITLGERIGSELRAHLAKGNQFHVYGKDHPVSQSLKTDLTTDPRWGAQAQRAFQQNLQRKFKPFPVDVVVIGRVNGEAGNRIKVETELLPFYKPITLVETESGRVGVVQERIVSSPLSAEEIGRALAVVRTPTKPKGRLVILSSMMVKRYKYPALTTGGSSAIEENLLLAERVEDSGRYLPLADIACWLNDRELTVIKDWQGLKRKDYYNLLSGFEADTFWFDEMVDEGRHLLFFSLALNSAKKTYKTFSETFRIQGGTTHYIYFYLLSDPYGEPQIRIRHVVDPKNQPLPF